MISRRVNNVKIFALTAAVLTSLVPIVAAKDIPSQLPDPDKKPPAGTKPQKPNLLFILTDQQSWDTLGAYGNTQIKTPNLDRLAERSTTFDYCFSNNPVCSPYRAMLLSGRNSWNNGVLINEQRLRAGNGRHLAEVLNAHGYRSGWVGKWHLYGGDRDRPIPAGPFRYGFDALFLSNNCTTTFTPDKTFFWNENGEKQPLNAYEPDGQTDQALAYIRSCAGRPDPWDLFISWHPPHNPHSHCPEKWSALYSPEKLKLRPGMPDTKGFRTRMSQYYGMISNLDWNVGRLIEALKTTGQYENTLIVFTSDHGDTLLIPSKSWHPRSYKRRPEDLSLRVPLIVHYPGQKKALRSQAPVGTMDLMPTILGLMGIPAPDGLDGRDFSQAVRTGIDTMEPPCVIPIWNVEMKWRGVATKRYSYSTGSLRRLLDREKDPHQMNNVYAHADYTEIQNRLHAATLEWMTDFGDNLDLSKVPVTDVSEHPYRLVAP